MPSIMRVSGFVNLQMFNAEIKTLKKGTPF